MAIKVGVNHSNNKEKCSAGNLDVTFYESIANQLVGGRKLFGHSLKLLANVQCTSRRK